MLLNHGANPNTSSTRYHHNPLLNAIKDRSSGFVQLLLTNGAQVNDKHVIEAANQGVIDIFQQIFDAGRFEHITACCLEEAFRKSSTSCYEDIMSLLLHNGVDIRTMVTEHDQALQIASAKGRRDIVKILLEKGADVNWVPCEGGETALQAAAAKGGHGDLAEFLLENGADVNLQGGRWGSAIIAAASEGHIEVVQLLLDNGAVNNLPNLGGQTALQVAYLHHHDDIVELIFEAYDDLDLVMEILSALEAIRKPSLEQDGRAWYSWGQMDVTIIPFARWLLTELMEVSRPNTPEGTLHVSSSTWSRLIEVCKLSLDVVEKGIIAKDGQAVALAMPMSLAAVRGWTDVVKFILRHDAMVEKVRRYFGRPSSTSYIKRS